MIRSSSNILNLHDLEFFSVVVKDRGSSGLEECTEIELVELHLILSANNPIQYCHEAKNENQNSRPLVAIGIKEV